MKVLIVVSAIFAIASAGLAPAVDTPEVAQAKAAHFAAHAEAKARLAVAPYAYSGYYPYSAYYPYHYPVIANGVPAETPEVVHAKAAHFAAHVEAKARNGDVAVVAPVAAYGYVSPVAHVPADTPEVAQAKVAHFAAHVEAKVRNGDVYAYAPFVHYRKRRGVYAGPLHYPVIQNGVPVETPEVAAAKSAHAAAHVAANHGVPVAYAAPVATYPAPVVVNGVPVDTAEVAHAKVAHFAAHAEAKARTAAPVAHYGYATYPVDTPEVAHAKAAHFAAHVEANARNGVYHHYY